jgi:hypothetical protein
LTDAPDVFGALVYRDTLQATAATSEEGEINTTTGICWIWQDTRYARGQIRIPAAVAWNYVSGLEPDLEPTGEI